jgi:hypothetical protein
VLAVAAEPAQSVKMLYHHHKLHFLVQEMEALV